MIEDLAQRWRGLVVVATISFALWVVAGASTTCFSVSILEGAEIPPDARLGGCDSAFTAGLRILAGDMDRKPFYDVVYGVNFSFLWFFGMALAGWLFTRRLLNLEAAAMS
ncbi:MAG: hypothetical protein AB1351_04345 [Thermoproteota archaeon]